MDIQNWPLLTDLYELTMMQGYFNSPQENKTVVFDLFYRINPSNASFAITCGLEQAIEYIKNLKFTDSQLNYLKSDKGRKGCMGGKRRSGFGIRP